jgi:hypothetical protein
VSLPSAFHVRGCLSPCRASPCQFYSKVRTKSNAVHHTLPAHRQIFGHHRSAFAIYMPGVANCGGKYFSCFLGQAQSSAVGCGGARMTHAETHHLLHVWLTTKSSRLSLLFSSPKHTRHSQKAFSIPTINPASSIDLFKSNGLPNRWGARRHLRICKVEV